MLQQLFGRLPDRPGIVADRFSRLFVLLAVILTPMAADAQTTDPQQVAIGLLQQLAPSERLKFVETALGEVDGDADIRGTFGLLQERADLIETLAPGRLGHALADLARFAERHRDLLDVNPAPILERAARAFAEAGQYRDAIRVMDLAVASRRDDNADAETISALMVTQADWVALLGSADGAQELRDRAADMLAPRPGDAPVGTRGLDDGFSVVDVYYATDRAPSGDNDPATFCGYERAELQYGIAKVSIPNRHRPGAIELPSIWRLEFAASPAKHVILQSVESVGENGFYDLVQSGLEERESDEAFIFIHGYNVSFERVAKRTAQLAYDMQFKGTALLFSWPSRGTTSGYIADTATVELSARRLSNFLEAFVQRSGAKRVHLIAHSMGNRALTEALELFALRVPPERLPRPVFEQVVFAAPDVDAKLFAEVLKTTRTLSLRQTLYGSQNDWALTVSRKLHGDATRAGEGGDNLLASPMIDSIDMSELGQDMLAHGYFADDTSALTDLIALFWRNVAPGHRCGLEPVEERKASRLWRYRVGVCSENALLGVLARVRELRVETAGAARRAVGSVVTDVDAARDIERVIDRMFAEDAAR